MKKMLYFMIALVLVFLASPVSAEKPVDTCKYVVDNTISYPDGHYLEDENYSTGYDVFGYNYQAHIFNGTYGNVYFGREGWTPYTGDDDAYLASHPTAISHWAWPFRNVNLQMKWNDAWLANKDCESPGSLDRHAGYPSYRGSGAWLTNHATGTYTSSTKYHWDVTGDWLLDFAGGTDNRQFRNLVQDSAGNVTGEFWWLNGSNWEYGGTLVGTVSDDTLQLHYDRAPILYTGDFEGTIGNGVITGGTFDDSHYNHLFWTATGISEQVYDICTVSDFVKIVAVPENAVMSGDYWTLDGSEIGPVIWGEFAVIQEIASDPCGEYGVIDYMSPLRKGLGNWASEIE